MLTPMSALPEIRLPAPTAVPPMLLFVAPLAISTPWFELPRSIVPVTSVPMKLPNTLLSDPGLTISTPLLFPEITFRASADTPPMVLSELVLTKTPWKKLPNRTVPVLSVPMKLPSTELLFEERMWIP